MRNGRNRATRSISGALALLLLACAGEPRFEPARVPPARPDDVAYTFFFLGDGGGPSAADPVLTALTEEVARSGGHRIVLYLGDNIYPNGLPAEDTRERAEAERRLDAQLDVVLRNENAEGFLIAGNHDWTFAGDGGWAAVLRQAEYVESRSGGRLRFVPSGGCPGPVAIDFGTTVRLIALDTEWWLYAGERPTHPDSSCPADSEEEVLDSLRSMLAQAGPEHVIVIGHHPILSGGPHGGFFGWDQHLFPLRDLRDWLWIPLPALGSIYPIARRFGVSQEDAGGYKNKRLRAALEEVFRESLPLLYASGHDHSLQVIEDVGARYQLVSGSGYYGHTQHVAWLDRTRFAARASGYMRVDVQTDGRVRLAVIEVDALSRRTERFSMYVEVE